MKSYPLCVRLRGYDSCLYCFFFIQGESKLISPVVVEQYLNWLPSISGKLGRICTGNITRIKYGRCWHNIMSCKPVWNVFLKDGYKWYPTVSWNVWILSALTISPVPWWRSSLESKSSKTQSATGVMASSSAWRTAWTREEIMDKSSCFVWRLLLSLATNGKV